MDRVQGYDEDQIALVIPDLSNFMVQVPIILGTPTKSHVVNVIKEKENDALGMPWVNAWVAHLLSVQRATATVEDDQAAWNSNLSGYNEVVLTRNTETIDAFLSCVIIVKARTAHTGGRINVMTQALHIEDGSLHQGLTVQNAYTELRKGSKNVVMVVRNSMAYPQMLRKKIPVARAVAVTQVTEHPAQTGLTEMLEEDHGYQMPKLTVKQRQEKLFEELDLSGLES